MIWVPDISTILVPFGFGFDDIMELGMLMFLFLSCSISSSPEASQDCADRQCDCPKATGELHVDAVTQAKLHIFDYKNEKNQQTIICEPETEGVQCSFSTKKTFVHAEVEVGANSFPVDIQVQYKAKNDCCACGELVFTPSHISIPYR